jgi:hypothetical protein
MSSVKMEHTSKTSTEKCNFWAQKRNNKKWPAYKVSRVAPYDETVFMKVVDYFVIKDNIGYILPTSNIRENEKDPAYLEYAVIVKFFFQR